METLLIDRRRLEVVTPRDRAGRMTMQQRLTVLLLLGTGFMLSVDFSILNVALPQVGTAVGLKFSQLPWIATAYALPAAGCTLLFGRIADLFGRRRMFLTGIALMGLSSMFGGLAMNPCMLLLARMLQGFATAIAMPAALSLLITSFTDEKQRARVLGLNGALRSSGFAVGALVGGAVVGELSWRWAFLINVPVALLILLITPFAVRTSRAPGGVKLDVPGAVTVTLGLLAFIFGVSDRSVYAITGGLILLAVFCFVEFRAKAPLVAINILSKPSIKWGNIATLVVFSMESGFIFLMTLYLQDVLFFSPLKTGVIFGIPGLAAIGAGILAGRLIGRYGYRMVLTFGMLIQAVFIAPMIFAGTGTIWLCVLMPCLFFGFLGHVTAIVASMVTATSDMSDSGQGLATGLASMSQLVGTTVGIPILSALAASRAGRLGGMHLALVCDVAVTVVVSALVWYGLRSKRSNPSNQVLP
jgi:MFS family permease